MTLQEIESLKAGDKVHWEDPDEGLCSQVILIARISINGDVVSLTDAEGSEVDALPEELTRVN
jgi:hypothetical protein